MLSISSKKLSRICLGYKKRIIKIFTFTELFWIQMEFHLNSICRTKSLTGGIFYRMFSFPFQAVQKQTNQWNQIPDESLCLRVKTIIFTNFLFQTNCRFRERCVKKSGSQTGQIESTRNINAGFIPFCIKHRTQCHSCSAFSSAWGRSKKFHDRVEEKCPEFYLFEVSQIIFWVFLKQQSNSN